MKLFVIKLSAIAFVLFALAGCTKNNSSLNLNVSAVQTLYDPEDNVAVVLQPSSSASVFFDWSPALAADGGMVMYEVAFDLPNGDFSKPVYKVLSDNKGMMPQATITHKVLNQIAAIAGAGPSETITLKWTVLSTKGTNEVLSTTSRKITITRLAGFANPPSSLYMAGQGSEAGQQFTGLGNGEFEIYTKLTSGQSFQFVDAVSGTANTYFIGNNGVLKQGTTGSTVSTTGVYHLEVDFTSGSTTMTQINSVNLFYDDTKTLIPIPYAGQGVWKVTNAPLTLKQESWGWEDRYKFEYMVTKPDGTPSTEWWGSVNGDNNSPTTGSTALSFWYLVPVTSDQWNNSFKFDHAFFATPPDITINVTVTMNASGPYTHSISQ